MPVHDDRMFFEFLTLEGTQAGLSWSTILKKREGYRAAFAGFDPAVVARFSDADVDDWRDAVSDSRIVVARSRIMHRTRSFTNHVS